MKSPRAAAAAVCGVLGIISLVLGVVYGYAARSFFHADTFAARVADGLANPAAARLVAEKVADQVIESRRDLTAYRPIIVGAMERVVESPPFRAVVRRAVREAHATLLSGTGTDITVSVADAGVIVRSALAMHPEIAARIPAGARAVLSVEDAWPSGKYLAMALRVASRVRARALVLVGLGLGLGALGLLAARDKRRYLVSNGVRLAGVALVVGLVARFGAGVAASLAGSPVGEDLVRALWPAFVEPLARRMLVLGALGLVPVAIATSLLDRVDVIATLRAGWRRATTRHERGLPLALRGALVLLLGAAIALHPAESVEVIVVLLGALVFLVGMCELFAGIGRALPERVVTDASSPAGRITRVALAALLPAALAVAAFVWFQRDTTPAPVAAVTDACNLHPELCGRRLDQVAFATTHNSMAAADITTWMFPNHEKGFATQLEDGVRGFLIDIHYGIPVGERVKTLLEDEAAAMKKYEEALGVEGVTAAMQIRDRLVGEATGERDVYLGHGFCELGAVRFVEALEVMREFLVANPGEVIIIVIQDEGVAPADVAACFAQSGLDRLVYRGPVQAPWPTLGEMVARDERVVVFAENNSDGVDWYHPAFEVFQETPYRFKDPSEFSNRPGRGGTSGSLLLLNHWIETTPAPKPSNAEIVNAFDVLYPRARDCRKTRRQMPTLVAVDFYRTGDLMRVVDTLNGVAPPAAPAP